MKILKFIILLLAGSFVVSGVAAQANAYVNILTQNGGVVTLGGTVNIEVTVGNTGPISQIGVNKVRAKIDVPGAISMVQANAQQTGLPPGWTILANTGTSITVCNGSDIIPVGTQRTILIKVQGTAIGGPSTVLGQLTFGPGTGVCTGPGTLAGDVTADNSSTSSIQVMAVTPLNLVDFNAILINCQPRLKWITESEINTDRFEIERGNVNNSNWISIGVVPAAVYTTTKSEYNYMDTNSNVASEQVLYRLKMIDRDGRYKYSEVLRVFTTCYTTRVDVYPNPVQNSRLYVSLTSARGYYEATLTSLSGQVILKNRITNGTNYLSTSNIAAGVYVLSIKNAHGFEKEVKVFIQH